MKYLLLVFILLFISGCAEKYQEPISGEYATISVPHDKIKYTIGFSGEQYFVGLLDETGCISKMTKVEEKSSNQDFETIKIPANKYFAIRVFSYVRNSNCFVDSSFKPEANKHYVVLSKVFDNICYLYVDRKEGNQTIIVGLENLKLSSGKLCR